MRDPGLSGLGPKDRRRALHNRAMRQRFLDTHPLAPLSEREIQHQATGDLAAQYDPLVRSINAHTRAGAANIAGISEQLAKNLAGYQQTQADVYDKARENLSNLDNAIADRLGATATAQSQGLQAKLQQAGIPASIADNAVAAMGHASGVGFARNSAELGQLQLAEQANQDYLQKLPAFARMLGLQQLGQYRARKQQELSDLNDKRLSAAAGLIQGIRSREYQKGATQLGFQGTMAGIQGQNQRATLAANAAMDRTNAQQAGANARNTASISSRERIATANRRERKAAAVLAEGGRNARARATAARQGASVDVNASQQAGVVITKGGKRLRWRTTTKDHKRGDLIKWKEKKHKGTQKSGGGNVWGGGG